jgi:hypothetical protein
MESGNTNRLVPVSSPYHIRMFMAGSIGGIMVALIPRGLDQSTLYFTKGRFYSPSGIRPITFIDTSNTTTA